MQPQEKRRGTIIVNNPAAVELRLRELKLDGALLQDTRTAWAAAAASTTVFEPITAAGFKGWAAATGTLRERLVGAGWSAKDLRCWPVVVEPEGVYALSVTSGDEMTGVVLGERQPTTKNPKGIVVANVVNATAAQVSFKFMETQTTNPSPVRVTTIPPTWFLMCLLTDDEMRAELSLPDAIDGEWITHWHERIILPVIPRRGPVMKQLPEEIFEEAPAPVVRVRKK